MCVCVEVKQRSPEVSIHLLFLIILRSSGYKSWSKPTSRFVSADVPGGAVEGAGEPREHTGGPSGSGSAGEELPDLEGPGCEDPEPAEMAGHRLQRTQGDQELRKTHSLRILGPTVDQGYCTAQTSLPSSNHK